MTDGWIAQCGMLGRLMDVLAAGGIAARAFAGAVPDPTVASIAKPPSRSCAMGTMTA